MTTNAPKRIWANCTTPLATRKSGTWTEDPYGQLFIRADLSPSPEVVKELVEAAKALNGIIEGIQGAMEHGTWRDEKGQRLKDTPEWVAFYNARAALAKLEAWE